MTCKKQLVDWSRSSKEIGYFVDLIAGQSSHVEAGVGLKEIGYFVDLIAGQSSHVVS